MCFYRRESLFEMEIYQLALLLTFWSLRVKGGMSLWSGMWHGSWNDIIMRNVICAE